MADSNETWSDRFAREFDALVRLLHQRPLLAIIFIVAIILLVVYQFFKVKRELIPKSQIDKPPSISLPRESRTPALTITQSPKPERFVSSIANGSVEIYIRENSDSINLRFRTNQNWTASAHFDVNQNYRIDPHVDVAYGNVGAQPCFQYVLSDLSSTMCGAFRSLATLDDALEVSGLWRSTTWFIPKVEITSGGSSVWLIPSAYNNSTTEYIKGSFNNPIRIHFPPGETK